MKFVGVAACPAGLMHTFMASKGLKKFAKKNGHEMYIETQSASGTEDTLTNDLIESADAVVLAIDTGIQGMDRFEGKPVLKISTKDAIRKTAEVIKQLEEMGK